MNASTEHTQWPGPHGPIEVAIDLPTATPPKGLAVIAHPHPLFGGTLHNKVVQTIARAFLQLGYATLRPNFRGVGLTAGEHGHGRGETTDHLWLIAHAQQHILAGALADKPLALAGFSFGAFVTSHVAHLLAEQDKAAERMVLVGTATSRFDVAHVPSNTIVIHGEQDETVPLLSVFDWARPQHLPVIVMPGVDHFFHGKLPQLRSIIVEHYPQALPALPVI